MTPTSQVARFVARPNRFVALVELPGGEVVRAYVPNTGRLTHVMVPGNRLVVRHESQPHRVTDYTVTRAWDGCWVAVDAAAASRLLADWLEAGHPLPGFGPVTSIRREVRHGPHRFDLRVSAASGPVWVEVKSGGRAAGTDALLSGTPSTRAAAHLTALAGLVAAGEPAAVAFVVQRPDVRRLRIGGDADPGWIAAVRGAASAGVALLAFGCEVTAAEVCVVRSLPIVDDA